MNYAIIRKVEAETQQKRREALLAARLRRESLFARYPELNELDKRKRELVSLKYRKKVNVEDADKQITETEKSIDLFCQANTIDMRLCEPQFSCPICEDTGFVTENGKPMRCRCVRQRMLNELYKENDSLCASQTFETFDLTVFAPSAPDGSSPRENMRKIAVFCEKYADSFPCVKRRNLVFCGPTGVGKTFLLNAVGARLLSNGHTVLYLTAGRLFEVLRRYALSQSDSIQELYDVDVLLIDDLGTEPVFNHITAEYLFMLINERIRSEKALLVSTNLTPGELEKRYTERITSRLFDTAVSTAFQIAGEDLRLHR